MDFKKPQDYVEALKRLEGLPLTGMEVQSGYLVFTSMSRRVALPLRNAKSGGCEVLSYGMNKLDVLVHTVEYKDHLGCIRLFDEDGEAIAHVTIKNVTRAEWLFGELHGRNLHSSVTINSYKKYVRLADGVVITEEADGLTGVFVHWPYLNSPVGHILDRGDSMLIVTDMGEAVELYFKGENDGD